MKTMRRAFRHSLCIVHSALCIAFAATAALAEDYVLSGALQKTWTEMGPCPSVGNIIFPIEAKSCGGYTGIYSCTSSFVRAESGGIYSAIFQWDDGTYIKHVKANFKIEGEKLYVQGVRAGYVTKSGSTPYPYDFNNQAYSSQTLATTLTGNGYGLKELTAHVLLNGILVTANPEGFGEASPGFGVVALESGASLSVSCPAVWTNAADNTAATCTGWKLYDADGEVVSSGPENAFTYVHPASGGYRRLEWQLAVEYKVTASAGAGGSVSHAVQWVPSNGTATVTATADAGLVFVKWTGDIPGSAKYDNPPVFTVHAPVEATANFLPATGSGTWHWTGAGANALASTPANWAEGTAPADLANIVFDAGGEGKPCTWDLDIPLQSWLQTNYTGTVTFQTVYAETGFSKLRIVGDCALHSGKWTHLANAAIYRQYRLYASVGGNMTVGPTASIDATDRGYSQQYVASTGAMRNLGNYHGGTYGGYGSWNNGLGTPHEGGIEPYGSITAPEDPGSGGLYRGGGAIRLDVAGCNRAEVLKWVGGAKQTEEGRVEKGGRDCSRQRMSTFTANDLRIAHGLPGNGVRADAHEVQPHTGANQVLKGV